MMKAILFASVLAVTIPAGFFSPTPLDSLTMNLNINDSPQGRHHGSGGYPPVSDYEEDVGSDPIMTTTPPTTDAREQKVLEKLMQGIKELKELDKSGKLSPQDNAGGEQCGPKQVVNCGLSMTDAVAKCAALLEIKGPLDFYTCIKDALGVHQSKCMPCVCQLLSIMGIPCPNPEMDEEEDAIALQTPTPPTTDAREQEVLEKLTQRIKELKELIRSGKLSPQDYAFGDECGPLQIVNCATLLTATTAKCAFLLVVSGPPGVFACMQEALGPQSTCITCVCQLMALLNIPCPNPEMGQKAFDYGGNATEPPMPSPGGECKCMDPHLGTDKNHCNKAAGRKYCDVTPQSSCVDKFCFNDEKCASVFACDGVEPPNLCEDCKCMDRDQCKDDPNDQCNTCQNASPFKICRLDVNSKCADRYCKEKNNCYGVVACGCGEEE